MTLHRPTILRAPVNRADRIEFHRLSYGIAAEVRGLDLTQPIDDALVARLRAGWLEHGVLVFPEQHIAPRQHIAFTARFGRLLIHPIGFYNHPDHPELMLVATHGRDGKPSPTKGVAPQFHSDLAFTLEPATGSMLHAQELPSVGGTTAFANMYLAYERLSETMKGVIADLWAIRDVTAVKGFKDKDPAHAAKLRADFPPVAQPVVRVHPETGRKALYIQENSPGIVGMTEEESRPLIDFLCRHATRPEFTYRHSWKVHDLLWWDNRCTMHLAVRDYEPGERRTMFRTTLAGEPCGRPYAYPA